MVSCVWYFYRSWQHFDSFSCTFFRWFPLFHISADQTYQFYWLPFSSDLYPSMHLCNSMASSVFCFYFSCILLWFLPLSLSTFCAMLSLSVCLSLYSVHMFYGFLCFMFLLFMNFTLINHLSIQILSSALSIYLSMYTFYGFICFMFLLLIASHLIHLPSLSTIYVFSLSIYLSLSLSIYRSINLFIYICCGFICFMFLLLIISSLINYLSLSLSIYQSLFFYFLTSSFSCFYYSRIPFDYLPSRSLSIYLSLLSALSSEFHHLSMTLLIISLWYKVPGEGNRTSWRRSTWTPLHRHIQRSFIDFRFLTWATSSIIQDGMLAAPVTAIFPPLEDSSSSLPYCKLLYSRLWSLPYCKGIGSEIFDKPQPNSPTINDCL